MFVGKDDALAIHEIRHGGQDARKEYDASNAVKTGYGVTEEVDAYRAQYSYGGLSYNSHNFDQSLSNTQNRALLNGGIVPPSARVNITNISGITPTMVNDIGIFYQSTAGNTVIPLYPPNGMTTNDFNNN
jgi:hypothetical protein